jgi:DNA invertase Pin-like site-specific DNA recombinase
MGKAMAHLAVVFAELERDFIRSRTREALAVRRDHGVVLVRPRSTPDDVVARVVRERTEGKTAYAIARDLNKDGVPTAQGARAWSQVTVRALLMREGVIDYSCLAPVPRPVFGASF